MDLGLSFCPSQKRSDPHTALESSCTVLARGETSWFSLLQGGSAVFSLCHIWVSTLTFLGFSLPPRDNGIRETVSLGAWVLRFGEVDENCLRTDNAAQVTGGTSCCHLCERAFTLKPNNDLCLGQHFAALDLKLGLSMRIHLKLPSTQVMK